MPSTHDDEPDMVVGQFDRAALADFYERLRVMHSLIEKRMGLDAEQAIAVSRMTDAERAAYLAELVDQAHAEALRHDA